MTSRAVTELEFELSTPLESDIEFARSLSGRIAILGAGGKMGPTLAMLISRAVRAAGADAEVVAVSRFTEPGLRERLEGSAVATVAADVLDQEQLDRLPDADQVVLMAGHKFGSSVDPGTTWMTNLVLPALALRRFSGARVVVFSTGNVYPLSSVSGHGPTEGSETGPVGEYALSALARERVVEYYSRRGTPAAIIRLNYAVEPRYGVVRDVADAVWSGEPIELEMGHVNFIWQRDANSMAFRSLGLATSPAKVLNVTGLEVVPVRRLAEAFGRRWGKQPVFRGRESETALLSDARLAAGLLGQPPMGSDEIVERVARWIEQDGGSLGKPTHFQEREGRF